MNAEKVQVLSTGVLNLSNKGIKTFSEVQVPRIVKTLVLKQNQITDFIGFEPPMNVEKLVIDGNPILSFLGFPEAHNILHFSAQQTLLSELPNFRSLVLLALGNQVQTINGVEVTNSERVAASFKSFHNFFGKDGSCDVPICEQNQLMKELGDFIRSGWVGPALPKNINVMKQEACQMENDPVSVRAIRLHTILKSDEADITHFIRTLFSPAPEKKRIVNNDAYDRLEKQQSLIAYMQEQLEELKQTENSVKEKQTKHVEKESMRDLSSETKTAYEEEVLSLAANLIENSERVIAAEERKARRRNPEGLRMAVKRITDAYDADDRELIDKLRSLNETE